MKDHREHHENHTEHRGFQISDTNEKRLGFGTRSLLLLYAV